MSPTTLPRLRPRITVLTHPMLHARREAIRRPFHQTHWHAALCSLVLVAMAILGGCAIVVIVLVTEEKVNTPANPAPAHHTP